MELASFLAREGWSDHTRYTDPTLDELARCVNDVMPDSHRSLLAPMIPSVIGTGPRDTEERVQLAARIVRTCAVTALPLVRTKAGPIACALLVAQRILGEKSPVDAEALAGHPEAHAYARAFVADNSREWADSRTYLTRAA